MDTELFEQRFIRRKSGGRRSSSILKTKTPLADLDPNQPITAAIIPRKKARISASRRVSFAETYQVKEFPRDSPNRWMPDLEAEDDASPELENLPDVPQHSSRSEIQGLDKLLTGPIQSSPSTGEDDSEELPLPDENEPIMQCGPNHTILQDDSMDMTDCLSNSNLIENLQKPLQDDFGDSLETLGDGKSVLPAFLKSFVDSSPDQIYLPEKMFSKGDKNHYHVDEESDFQALINTSINKYNRSNASQTTLAGTACTSVTSAFSVISSTSQQKPFATVDENMKFKPVTVEKTKTIDLSDKITGTVDGLSFLKQLGTKNTKTKTFEEQTILFDGNDMEETEVLTKCIQNGDKDSSLLPKIVKIPSFLKPCKNTKSDDEHTMFFGQDNDIEATEVVDCKIDIGDSSERTGKDTERTIHISNDMEQTEPLPSIIMQRPDIGKVIPLSGSRMHSAGNHLTNLKEKTRLEFLSNASKINRSIRKISGLICANDGDNKTQIFEKGDDMEQTDILTRTVDMGSDQKSLRTNDSEKTMLFEDGLIDETGLLTSKINLVKSSKLLEKNKTVLYKDDDMEETNVLSQKLGHLKSRKSLGIYDGSKTELFTDENNMDQTVALTNKIELPVLSMSDLSRQAEGKIGMKIDALQKTELPSLSKKFEWSGMNFNQEKTVLFNDGNDVEETKALTVRIDTDSDIEQRKKEALIDKNTGKPENKEVLDDKTRIFKDGNDIEETCTFKSNGNTMSFITENRTTIFQDNNEMEETCTFTSRAEYLSHVKSTSQKLNDNKEILDGNLGLTSQVPGKGTLLITDTDDMEETKTVTGKVEFMSEGLENYTQLSMGINKTSESTKIEIGLNLPLNKTMIFKDGSEMEYKKTLTASIESNTGNYAGNKTVIFQDDTEMEQTTAVTSMIEFDKTVDRNKTLQFKDEDMEQTNAFTGKLKAGLTAVGNKTKQKLDKTVDRNKTLQFKDEDMEQTNAFTGKLEAGLSVVGNKTKQILDKTVDRNKTLQFKDEDMEQTNAFTGKLEAGLSVVGNKTKQMLDKTVDRNKTLQFKDEDMEQTNAFTGKLEAGLSMVGNKTKQKLDKTVDRNKTLQHKDEDMEQTNAFTGKLEAGLSMVGNKKKQTQAFTRKLEIVSNFLENKTIHFIDGNEMEETKAWTGDLEQKADTIGNKSLQFKEEKMTNFNIGNHGFKSDENEFIKNRYKKNRALIQSIRNQHSFEMDKSEKSMELNNGTGIINENHATQLEKGEGDKEELRGGMKSLIAKLRQDMKCSDGDEFTEKFEITENNFDDFKTENMGNEMTINKSKNVDEGMSLELKTNNQNLIGIIEKMGKNTRKSFGLHSRTPMGKAFVTSRESCSEMNSQTKASTVKLTTNISEYLEKDHEQHNPHSCSKELFSKDFEMKDLGEVNNSLLPELGSCMNITFRNRSKSEGGENADEFIADLELPTSNIITGISEELVPSEMLTNSAMMSVHPDITTCSQCPEVNLTTSSGAQSIIESQIDDLLKQSMMEDGDGPMSVQSFCRRIQMVLPWWLKDEKIFSYRRSIATLSKVDKESTKGQLEAKYVHQAYCEVYNKVIEEAQATCSKGEAEVLGEDLRKYQPAIFDIAINGTQEQKTDTRDKLKILTKCCKKFAESKWKAMKLECHEQFCDKIQENKEELRETVNQIISASDALQQQLSSLSEASSQLDNLIFELEQKPVPSAQDMELWKSTVQEVKFKEQELKGIKDGLQRLIREKSEFEMEKLQLEKEENAMDTEEATDENSALQAEINELEEKLDTLQSLIEWHIEDYEEDFITFLFYDDTMRLSLNKQKEADNGRCKIASAHVTSLLDSHAKPLQKLIHSMILTRIEEVSLLQSYNYISELPELLQSLSHIVLDARNLKRQINSICLKYLVTVCEDFVKVEKWSLKTLRKVNLKFTFNDKVDLLHVLPEVTVVMGNVKSEAILEQLQSVSKGQDYLIKLCDRVDLDILSDMKKIS